MEYTPVEENQDKKHEIQPIETTTAKLLLNFDSFVKKWPKRVVRQKIQTNHIVAIVLDPLAVIHLDNRLHVAIFVV